MKTEIRKSLTLILFFLSYHVGISQCTSIDQSQLNYNGGTSARNLDGYSEWQSFQAGNTGILCKIEVGLFNFMNGTGIFRVYEGIGTAGTILSEDTVLISGDGNFFFPFDVSVPITAGLNYTFHLKPILNGGLPDPYGVQVQNPRTYTTGEMYLVDPSGSYATGFDMVFKTYVETNTGLKQTDPIPHSIIYPNPSNGFITIDNRGIEGVNLIEIIDIQGKTIKKISNENLQEIKLNTSEFRSGMYFIRIKSEKGIVQNNKLILSL